VYAFLLEAGIGISSLFIVFLNTGMGCPVIEWCLHPWSYSEWDWTWS